MKRKWKITWIIIILVVLFLFLANLSEDKNPNTKPTPTPDSTIPITSGNYKIGIGYFPLNSLMNAETAWKKAREVSDLAYIQRHWKQSSNPDGLDFYNAVAIDIEQAERNGLDTYIAFETLSTGRESLELPSGLSGDFSDTEIQEEYLKVVKKTADFKPDYFLLNVEINLYKTNNPDDYEAYKELYSEAYDEIKSVSPGTKVAVSLVFMDFDNKNCLDNADLNTLKTQLSDFPKQDLLAVSTYPLCFEQTSKIPSDLFTKITTLSNKPLFISETAWISLYDEQEQSNYIKKLSEMAKDAESNGKRIEAINYVSLLDPQKEVCDIIAQSGFGWYCTLSLIDKDGNEKLSYFAMKDWKN